jgi:hypothetical protein
MNKIAQYAVFWMTGEHNNFEQGLSRFGCSGKKHEQEKGSDKTFI